MKISDLISRTSLVGLVSVAVACGSQKDERSASPQSNAGASIPRLATLLSQSEFTKESQCGIDKIIFKPKGTYGLPMNEIQVFLKDGKGYVAYSLNDRNLQSEDGKIHPARLSLTATSIKSESVDHDVGGRFNKSETLLKNELSATLKDGKMTSVTLTLSKWQSGFMGMGGSWKVVNKTDCQK